MTVLLSACHDCDALYRIPDVPSGSVVRCLRCGAELYRDRAHSLDIPLAWTCTGMILFLIANLNPLLILQLGGRMQSNTLLAGVQALAYEGMWDLAILVFCTSILFPFLILALLLYVLLPLRFDYMPWQLARIFRLVQAVTPWAMVGVYVLGIFVAYVKLISMATVVPGIALYALFALLLVTSALQATLDPRMIWSRIPVSP
ncbi:MAG: paraquat-inducible protein A [Magnetococcus sp. YQC-5]